MYARLGERLDRIFGAKTAKAFEPLKVATVADLLLHLPRRYFSGTELSDLSALRPGEEVAVMAEVVDVRTFFPSGSGRSRPAAAARPDCRPSSPTIAARRPWPSSGPRT